MSANYWTAPGARNHGKRNSPCTNDIYKISTKILFSDPKQFPKQNGIVCIIYVDYRAFYNKSLRYF